MASARLRPDCLSFVELLAQAITPSQPTMTAALIIAVIYSNTGDWRWLSYALGTVVLAVVALNLNQFARRSTSAGCTYAINMATLSWSSLGRGVVVAMFGLVGFECATAFGEEAKDPLKTIPRAVIWSLIISGAFFVVVTYTMIIGTRGYSDPLNKIDAPLNVMAQMAHVGLLQIPLSAGAMVSFFALCLSCINAGSRVIYAMGRHGIFHSAMGAAHEANGTPHFAVTVMSVIAFAVPTTLVSLNQVPLDVFGWVGTLAAFGFLMPYILITLSAPAYLRKLGELSGKDWAVCGASLALLLIPTVGSIYPIPAAPVRYFPYLYLLYLAAGILWIVSFHRRKPTVGQAIRAELDGMDARFQAVGAAAARKPSTAH